MVLEYDLAKARRAMTEKEKERLKLAWGISNHLIFGDVTSSSMLAETIVTFQRCDDNYIGAIGALPFSCAVLKLYECTKVSI